ATSFLHGQHPYGAPGVGNARKPHPDDRQHYQYLLECRSQLSLHEKTRCGRNRAFDQLRLFGVVSLPSLLVAPDLKQGKVLRISLVISSLASGGAEKVMATIANYWAEKDNSVTLITLGPQSTDFYQLHPKVKRVALNLARVSHNPLSGLLNNLRRLKRLREEIRRDSPAVVLSFMDTTNVLTLVATFGLRIPVIVSEHIDPRQHRISRVWESLRRLMYPYAKTVVVLTEELRGWA